MRTLPSRHPWRAGYKSSKDLNWFFRKNGCSAEISGTLAKCAKRRMTASLPPSHLIASFISSMRTIVIVPTYNERENIGPFMDAIRSTCPEADILVVDDNSPDKTADIVSERKKSDTKIHLLSRAGKEGLGRAYIAGFGWALDNQFERIVQIDADFSHRPMDLRNILNHANEADVSLGSRWVKGGGTARWTLLRKLISRGGSLYAGIILGYPIRDWTGGFNVWTREVLKDINFQTVQSNGYSFQIEMKYRALRKGFRVQEIPILFEDRKAGTSKMSMRIVFEAFFRVWRFRFQNLG
jgi:dolichol-phosphate mannosyltransferase